MNHLRKLSSDLFPTDSSLEAGIVAGLAFLIITCFLSPSIQLLLQGTLVAILAGATAAKALAARRERRKWDNVLQMLPIPFALAAEPRFFGEYVKIAESLTKIVKHNDLLFQDLARARMEDLTNDLATLARGNVVYDGTETWRMAYQRVLETLRVRTYYSVALVRTNDYWADAPGRQSVQVNYELIGRGFRIERLHILSEGVWPLEAKLPNEDVLKWLVEQQSRGIHVSLARESDLAKEPDLLRDFAVYGDRATGEQELNEHGRTQRFVLSFDPASIRQSLDRWERLKLFSVSFSEMLDHLDQA